MLINPKNKIKNNTIETIVDSLWENFNLFFKNLEIGCISIDKNTAIKKGSKKIPNLNNKNTSSNTSAMYNMKYNFLKSNFLYSDIYAPLICNLYDIIEQIFKIVNINIFIYI